jgi:hypothetical protein
VHGIGTDGRHRKTFRALLKHQCRMMIAASIPSTKHKLPTSVVVGAKAAAEPTRRVETTVENFMVDQVIVYMRKSSKKLQTSHQNGRYPAACERRYLLEVARIGNASTRCTRNRAKKICFQQLTSVRAFALVKLLLSR